MQQPHKKLLFQTDLWQFEIIHLVTEYQLKSISSLKTWCAELKMVSVGIIKDEFVGVCRRVFAEVGVLSVCLDVLKWESA